MDSHAAQNSLVHCGRKNNIVGAKHLAQLGTSEFLGDSPG